MARSKNNSSISEEAKDHIELGRLLQQTRDPDVKKSVRKIMACRTPIREKMQQIRELDEKQLPEDSEGRTSDGKKHPFNCSFSTIKASIKKPQLSASYLVYLLHHHREMSEFGKKAHVFINVFFPPCVRPDPDLMTTLGMRLQPNASELLKMCNRALEQSWRYLEKKQHNLIVVVQLLCYEILSLNFKVLNFKDRLLSNRFRTLEALFLSLHYQLDYLPDFVESLRTVLKFDTDSKEESDRIEILVQRILFKEATLPSLYNFLLSLNQYMLRRFVDWEDLIFHDLGEIINTKEFAGKQELQAKIDSKIQDLRKQLELLRSRKKEILNLKRIIALEESGELSLTPLRNFYEQADVSKGSFNFQTDQNNVMCIFPRFLHAFDCTFDPLLNTKVSLGKMDPISLFAPSFFQMDFHRLRQLIGKFAGLAYDFRTLSKQRFLDLKEKRKDGIPAEYNIIRLIDDALDLIIQIGRKLEGVITSPFRKIDQREDAYGFKPIISSGRDFYLPDRGKEIVSSDCLDGKTVTEALRFAVVICFTIAAFFQNPQILDLLDGEDSINENLSQTVDELKRIADAGVLRELALI